MVTGIGEALPELIPAAVEMIVALVQGLVDALPMILQAALQLILGLAQGLLEAIPELIESTKLLAYRLQRCTRDDPLTLYHFKIRYRGEMD